MHDTPEVSHASAVSSTAAPPPAHRTPTPSPGPSPAAARVAASGGSSRPAGESGSHPAATHSDAHTSGHPGTHGSSADGVSFSRELDDDDEPSGHSTRLLGFGRETLSHLPPEDREDIKNSQDCVEVRSDGTVFERKDGRATTTRPDGSVSVEYRDGNRNVTDHTYTRNGAKVHDVEFRSDNGDVRTESTVEKNGRTEKTVTTRTTSDQAIEDLAPELRGSDAMKTGLAREGQRDKTDVATVTKTVTDTKKHPPETKTVLERTSYSQHISLGDRDPRASGLPVDNVQTPRADTSQPCPQPTGSPQQGDFWRNSHIDPVASGQTIAYTRETSTDSKGKSHTSTEQGSSRVVSGTTGDGKPFQVTQSEAVTTRDGRSQAVDSTEVRGVYAKNKGGAVDIGTVGDLSRKGEYLDRLDDGTVNYRETRTYDVDGSGRRKEVGHAQEYGDYDHPDQAGRSVTITDKDGGKYWTYRRSDATEGGVHTRTQTSREGSDGHIDTDETKNRDGTFKSETSCWDGQGQRVHYEQRERRIVNDAQVRDGMFGNKPYADEFLRDNEGHEMYQDTVTVLDGNVNGRPDPNKSTFVQQYTAEGSPDKLTHASRVGIDDIPLNSDVFILEEPGSDTPARMQAGVGGPKFEIDRDGRSYAVADGSRVQIPAGGSPGSVKLVDAVNSQSGAFTNLFGAVATLKQRGPEVVELLDKYPRLAGPFSALGLCMGAAQYYNGIAQANAGDILGGAGATASGLADASTLATKVVSSTRMTELLGVGGRTLGGAGAVLGAGYGAYQIAQGDYVEGGFTLAAAAGSGLAVGGSIAGASSWVPVAGWAVAGVAIAGGLAYDCWNIDREAHATHPLAF